MAKSTLWTAVLLTLVCACSDFRKVQKSNDWRTKYDAALEYYEEGEYYKANMLLENILPIIKGTREAEKAQFYYAYSYYHQGKYVLASHYFQEFFNTYSRSDFAQESVYMYAYSLYQQSPRHSLDQTSTYEAINAMQRFLNQYPYSDYTEKANNIIGELRGKLEKKAYDNAKLYYDLGNYKAAIIAFNNFRAGYPDSHFNEDASYYKMMAGYNLAEQSIQSLQKERYHTAMQYYQMFVDNYPDSKYIKDAESIYEDMLSDVKKKDNNKES